MALDQTVDLEVVHLETMDIHRVLREVMAPLEAMANLEIMDSHRVGQTVSFFYLLQCMFYKIQ